MANEEQKPEQAPLQESAFIQEGYRKNPYPIWLWLALLAVLLSLLWGGGSWYAKREAMPSKDNPFFNVTNRQISLFLWQNPSFMRRNVSRKEGYLPGFKHIERVSMDPSFAEEMAEVPPNILFLYHTWSRLTAKDFSQRKIPSMEFATFLKACEEWQPKYWKKAPKAYIQTFENFSPKEGVDLQTLSLSELPQEVRMAFQGWKNYTLEGEAINQVSPTYLQLKQFLKDHPAYVRPLWKNIHDISGDHYLKSFFLGNFIEENKVPKEEIPPFFKVAFYNWMHRIQA